MDETDLTADELATLKQIYFYVESQEGRRGLLHNEIRHPASKLLTESLEEKALIYYEEDRHMRRWFLYPDAIALVERNINARIGGPKTGQKMEYLCPTCMRDTIHVQSGDGTYLCGKCLSENPPPEESTSSGGGWAPPTGMSEVPSGPRLNEEVPIYEGLHYETLNFNRREIEIIHLWFDSYRMAHDGVTSDERRVARHLFAT